MIIIAHNKLNSLESFLNVLLNIIMIIRKKSGSSEEKITGDSY